MTKREFVAFLLEWFKKNKRDFPWRDKNPYKVFVSEVFLQRTPADRVALFFNDFISEYPTVTLLSEANIEKMITRYHQLGLHKRFIWLVNSMKIIEKEYQSRIPTEKNQLLKLPGIGEYTSSAILCFAYNKREVIVDVNIIRFYSRYFGISKNEVNKKASYILPILNWLEFNQAILDYSSLICSSTPKCEKCEFKKTCIYFNRLIC